MMDCLAGKHIVLLGIGHSNAHVLRKWGMNPIPDTDLTCISHHGMATYSGMLPAVLAGQKPSEEMQIDLVRLCASVGARLITDNVIGIDKVGRKINFLTRPSIPFDVLSIGIGSVPTMSGGQIESDSVVTIKPMQTFLQRTSAALDAAAKRRNGRHLRVLIAGSGVAGIEIAFCLPEFIRQRIHTPFNIQIVSRSNELASGVSRSMRRRIRAALQNVQITLGTSITHVHHDRVELHDGTQIEADVVIWATEAAAPQLLSTFQLPVDDRGFISTSKTLQSVSKEPIFAVGDSGSIVDESLPKAGVYAVRQGPILWENIQRFLDGRSLLEYRPQRSFLKLINTGDGKAIGEWKRWSFAGGWVMRLKNHIDTKFMNMFRVANMNAAIEAMPCRGCGCKLGGDILNSVLMTAGNSLSPSIYPLDDGAIVETSGGEKIVTSTDFFSAPFDDAFLNGRVAALHAASDLTAMGASITAALSIVVIPAGSAGSQQQMLNDLLAGARLEFAAMNARIVGGHTITGPRCEVGFTVMGEPLRREFVCKKGLRTGDLLYLTKPLGVGILLAAHMRNACSASNYFTLVESMLRRQHGISRIAADLNIVGGTDITGFGLVGHLIEMLNASGKTAVLEIDRVPLLPGVAEAIASRIESSLAPSNRYRESQIEVELEKKLLPAYQALFDPQTCGGLLLAVPTDESCRFESAVESLCGYIPKMIGHICDSASGNFLVKIV